MVLGTPSTQFYDLSKGTDMLSTLAFPPLITEYWSVGVGPLPVPFINRLRILILSA